MREYKLRHHIRLWSKFRHVGGRNTSVSPFAEKDKRESLQLYPNMSVSTRHQEYELVTPHAIPLQTQTRCHVDTIRILVAKNRFTRLAPKELGRILLTQGTCTLSYHVQRDEGEEVVFKEHSISAILTSCCCLDAM
jgi:hypothetical protein